MPSGCISKHPCTFCAALLMNADHRPARGRRVPLQFGILFSSMRVRCPAHQSWPLMSKASKPSISQRSSTVVFSILSFPGMPQIFPRHLRWNWSSLFTCQQYQVQDSLPYKSMVSTTVLHTAILVLRWIP